VNAYFLYGHADQPIVTESSKLLVDAFPGRTDHIGKVFLTQTKADMHRISILAPEHLAYFE
jgi:hypothetical protein